MSSLRNAVKRITHKERCQPQSRSHLGILEKKKDYKERARDYHSKEDRMNWMRKRASEKNPDEFYFGMYRAVIKDGRHAKTEEAYREELKDLIGADAVRIMKDQDLSYVRLQKQRDSKKVERFRASLHYLETGESGGYRGEKRKHTVFVESKQDADTFDVAEHFDTVPELAGRAFNRPRVQTLRNAAIVEGESYNMSVADLKKHKKKERKLSGQIARERSKAYREMEARTQRVKAMKLAEAHLETEKLVAGKGRKRKIQGAHDGKPPIYKWRRKRLR